MDPSHKLIIVTEIEKWRQNDLLIGPYCDFLLALYTEGKTLPKNKIRTKRKACDKEIKKTMIKELNKWKENQLLPTEYCDYLLTFYMVSRKKETNLLGNFVVKKEYLYFLLLIPIALIFFYFTELKPTMQIGLVVFFIFVGFGITYYFFKKGGWFQVPLAISAFLTLIFSVQWVTGIYPENLTALYYTILGNCGVWLLFGLVFRMISFTLSGILGAILVIYFMF